MLLLLSINTFCKALADCQGHSLPLSDLPNKQRKLFWRFCNRIVDCRYCSLVYFVDEALSYWLFNWITSIKSRGVSLHTWCRNLPVVKWMRLWVKSRPVSIWIVPWAHRFCGAVEISDGVKMNRKLFTLNCPLNLEVCRDKDMSVGTQNGSTVGEHLDFCCSQFVRFVLVLPLFFQSSSFFPGELIIL